MAPSLPHAKANISYPLYAADFDPLNPDFLIVGGGGGYTSSGVPNKITLLDTSRRGQITPIIDIELPKDGDSVSSIAVAQSTETSLTAFAGINSPLADQSRGKNEHFRSFKIDLPPKNFASEVSEKPFVQGKTEALGSLALFRTTAGSKNEAYQRVTRLSPTKGPGSPRVAAIATGLASENEIVVVKATPTPQASDILSRISLGKTEAADVDVHAADGGFTVAYCTDDKVYVQKLSASGKGSPSAPAEIYESTASASGLKASDRPKFRSLRFLSPRHLLLLQNQPQRAGVNLLILRLAEDETNAQARLTKRLSNSTKTAVGLDVCTLSSSPAGDYQLVIAVAGQNSCIEIMTLEYSASHGTSTFRPYTVLKDVHAGPITGLRFSNFLPPATPVTKETKPQYVKLASVGVDQTVSVHTIPLRPYPAGASKNPRYVLTPPGTSETVQVSFSVFMAIVVIGLVAFLLQSFSEIRGAVPPTIGASDWLSPKLKDMIARPYIFADGGRPVIASEMPEILSAATSAVAHAASDLPRVAALTDDLSSVIASVASAATDAAAPQAIVLRDTAGDLLTEVHHEADAVKAASVKKWDELTEPEKTSWKKRLSEAGHWSANQGESVLKGIFFSELAGVVGDIVRGS